MGTITEQKRGNLKKEIEKGKMENSALLLGMRKNDRKRYDREKSGEFSSSVRVFGSDQGSGCKIVCDEKLYLFEKKFKSFM